MRFSENLRKPKAIKRVFIAEALPNLSIRILSKTPSSALPAFDKLGGASANRASSFAFGLHKFSVYRLYHKENRLVYTKVSQPIRP